MGPAEELDAAIATCTAVLSAHDLEIVDIRLLGSGKGRILRVTLDREDPPLGIDDLSEISEVLSRALDVEDPLEGSYTLEVETAGLERPLTKPEHFVRFKGRRVKVKVTEPIEGEKVFEGTMASASSDTALIQLDRGVVEIPFSSMKKAKLVVDWDAELKRSVGTGEN